MCPKRKGFTGSELVALAANAYDIQCDLGKARAVVLAERVSADKLSIVI